MPIKKNSHRIRSPKGRNTRLVQTSQPHAEGVKQEIEDLVKAGVDGFILKGASFDQFLRAIRSAAERGNILPLPVTKSLVSKVVKQAVRKRKLGTLKRPK